VGKDELLRRPTTWCWCCPIRRGPPRIARKLALMKPTATLVNIARGGIVDEDALAAALRERRIAAAGLDVSSRASRGQPGAADAAQRRADAAYRQRHAAHPRRAMARLAADNLVAALTAAPAAHAAEPRSPVR
jgi:gluconate 2-dehydrogenase